MCVSEDRDALANFSGVTRLFPLPSLVLFPHGVQPLHIFEPRYRAMTADALASDRLISLALLMPGWENEYEGRPAIYPVACLGRIIADQRLPDGRYNLLLRGLARVRILAERHEGHAYRTAEVEIIEDTNSPLPARATELRTALADLVMPRFSGNEETRLQLRGLFDGDLGLGALCDILGFALPLPLTHKQSLLEEASVLARAESLLNALRPPMRKFPPDFSAN